MTETCDRWSIALEQERQGELSGDERGALLDHLAGCERCRAEQRAIASLAYELSSPAASPHAGWDDLRARIEKAHRRRQREILIGLAVAVAIGAVLVAVRGRIVGAVFDSFGSGLAVGMAFAVVVAGGATWLAARRAARALPGTDLLADIRRQYQRRIRGTRFFALYFPVFLTWLAFTASPRALGSGSAGLALRISLVALAIVGAVNGWFRVVPRLSRELHDLEGK
jgi:hypothetical protein